MKAFFLRALPFLAALVFAPLGYSQTLVELTVNGDFETGDTSSWLSFPSTNSSFDAISTPATDVYAGTTSGFLENLAETSAALVKQANLGIGIVEPSTEVNISFWAMGSGAVGGVQFAEFFSELDGGGVSSAEILGGGPLFLTDTYTFYEFTTTTGSDVSGGVTLQLVATTGADVGSTSTFFFDDVSVTTLSDSILGDFNDDGNVNGDDVDFYIGNLGQTAEGELAQLDLNDDGNVTLADHDLHVTTLVKTSNDITGALLGDVNLDGAADVLADGAAIVANLGQSVTSRSQGDLNADGIVDVLGDAALLINDLGSSNQPAAGPATSAVPEPGCLALLSLAGLSVAARRKR